jgi:hypothetical protein
MNESGHADGIWRGLRCNLEVDKSFMQITLRKGEMKKQKKERR